MSGEEEAGQPQRYCGSCGAETRPGSAFCTSCGASLVPGNEDTGQTHAEAAPEGAYGEGRRDEGGVGLPETGHERSTHPFSSALKEATTGYANRFSGGFKRKVAGGGIRPGDSNRDRLGAGPGNLLRWIGALPEAVKGVVAGLVVIAVLVLLVLLSPLVLLVTTVAFAVSVTVLVIRARQGRSVKGWSTAAVASLVLAFTFGGVSYGLYSNESSSGANSKAVGVSKADAAADLSPDERQYLEQVIEISGEMARIGARQVELHDFCLEACGPQHFKEQNQNRQRSSTLLRNANALNPPAGYEQHHTAFVSGVQILEQITKRVQFNAIGPTEANSLTEEVGDHFRRSHDLAPVEGQRFLEQNVPSPSGPGI